ncbi:MAG: VWA domain-containing protein [Myxococcales bacterium]|nr:VWA domain-containing protein [Myxococcales bacterium]MCB9531951.1 VWA domain-containing protein [Myxococcales bacterium]MCB9532836.1 VWA domain-containing protein [Myxococcales bacterium]
MRISRTLCLVLAASGAAACSAASSSGVDGEDTGVSVVDTGGIRDDAGLDGGAELGPDAAYDAGAELDGVDDLTEDLGDDAPRGPVCGNGIVERGEACDDGNNFPNDGCNPICTSDESCGNGFVDTAEQCDDGNVLNGDGCDARCRHEEGCGNGVVEVGEQCDDGNVFNGDGCSSGCVREVLVARDTDGDTISDFDEGSGFVDTDADGTPDSEDLDSDNDGIPDSVEAGDADMGSEPVDTDGDGRYDFRDLDSDNDRIPDAEEGYVDTDGDGVPNFADTDSDQDYVPDIVETTRDTEGDGTPDYIDIDSDNDGILDAHELFADSDGDGSPNRLDTDSDNDTLPDSLEAGDSDPATFPVDTDGDGLPDYIDTDSDADGMPDVSERGCAAGSSERLLPDSDYDGYSDLAEVLVGANPCAFDDAASFRRYTDFFFILPWNLPAQTAPLEFASDIIQADVSIAMDTTGSMGGEIGNLRSAFSGQIFPQVRAQIPNIAFGVSTFDDYPCNGHGAGADQPFILRQRVTTNVGAAQSAIDGIGLHNGADGPESGYESMYQVATGRGVSNCGASVPAFNPAAGLVPGVADGTIGGVGFRNGSFPILVHVTDATSHDEGSYGAFAASSSEAIAALSAIGARFIGVASGSEPRGQLEAVARATGGVVPVCAWDGARPGGCGAGQCCTGTNGGGRGSESGTCPLVFDVDGNGNGLGGAMVTAISALVNTTAFTVTTRIRRDEGEYIETGVDTRCFLQSVSPARFTTSGSCTSTPVPADLNPVDGRLDSFRNVTPGTQLFFDVVAANAGCVPEREMPQAFSTYIDVIGDGLTTLDTQLVTIIVPARSENPSTVP